MNVVKRLTLSDLVRLIQGGQRSSGRPSHVGMRPHRLGALKDLPPLHISTLKHGVVRENIGSLGEARNVEGPDQVKRRGGRGREKGEDEVRTERERPFILPLA